MTNLTLDNAIFLVNPVSGKLSLNKKINIINEIIRGSDATVLVSDSVDDAISKCQSSMMNNRIVVACGGDGFQNIIAHQAIKNKGIMAILPFGRGNDFANSLNIKSSRDLINSFYYPKLFNARYIDVKFDNYSRISLTCAGVGLLSEAAFRASKIPILRGMPLYTIATLISFINLKNHKYKISYNNNVVNEELLILASAASKYTGGGMLIAPDALKEKKKINLLFAHKANHFQAFNLLMKVFSGQHLHHQLVKSLHSKCVKISTSSKNSWADLVYGDGEFLGNLPVSTSLGTEKLLVLVPKV